MKKVSEILKKYGNDYFFLSFWLIIFIVFTVVPIIWAVCLSFSDFDMVQLPKFVGLENYMQLFLGDDIFIKALMNTLLFAVITGPLGYILSFVLGWLINELPHVPRTALTILFYSPSLLGASYTMWLYFFSGDSYGLLNSWLQNAGLLDEPIQWLTDPAHNVYAVIIVVLWGSFGPGFLSFVAGFQSLNPSYFEAGAIDGVSNRWQELWYITLPQLRPQLLIGAVLTISGSFAIGAQCSALTGFPSTDYSTHTLLLHMQDYSTNRLEMGYASAVAVVLFVLMVVSWTAINKAIRVFADD